MYWVGKKQGHDCQRHIVQATSVTLAHLITPSPHYPLVPRHYLGQLEAKSLSICSGKPFWALNYTPHEAWKAWLWFINVTTEPISKDTQIGYKMFDSQKAILTSQKFNVFSEICTFTIIHPISLLVIELLNYRHDWADWATIVSSSWLVWWGRVAASAQCLSLSWL